MPAPSNPESLPHREPRPTSADWWVTAAQASDSAHRYLDEAASAPDLLHTLTEIGRAHAATAEALGAAVNALLTAGYPWGAVAAALGHPDAPTAQTRTAGARDGAHRALLARLDHSARQPPQSPAHVQHPA